MEKWLPACIRWNDDYRCHVRPKGSQDESFELSRQSVMGSASNWLVAWPGAFRMDIVRKVGAKIE